MLPPPRKQNRLLYFVAFCVIAALFATSYTQAPLYYSNQNQYFLHGLAAADHGFLREDWLVTTLDPTPIFTALVSVTARFVDPWLFHVYHGFLLGAYAAAMLALFLAVAGKDLAGRRWPVFLALLFLVHAALTRWLSYRLFGQDYPWYFQAGVAGQYLLGGMLQPSVFGVLLIVALALFALDKPFLAGLAVAVAATIHSTYLLPGALLTLGFLTALVSEGRHRQALALAVFTFVLILPVTFYVVWTFAPTSADTFAQSQDILVNLRIPHHARTDLWLDVVALAQLAWIGLGVYLTKGNRVFPVLAVALGMMLVLTLLQWLTGNHTLALLFPWRVSTVLVPVATTIVLAKLVTTPFPVLASRAAWACSALIIATFVAGGIWIMAARQGFPSADSEIPLLDFVRAHVKSGDVYLLPVRVPDLARTTRGSLSKDFKPSQEKRDDARLIPPDLQRFRLYTGAPIYVDFKCIPYKDVEVIEWHRRLFLASEAQELFRVGRRAEALPNLRREGVSHIIAPAIAPLSDPALHEIYADPLYRVYRLTTD